MAGRWQPWPADTWGHPKALTRACACDLDQVAQPLGASAVPPVRRAVLAGWPLYVQSSDGDNNDASNHTVPPFQGLGLFTD